jgi:hypothetical protein
MRNTKKLSFCDELKIILDEMLACIDVDAWEACGAPERCGILGETVCTIMFHIFSLCQIEQRRQTKIKTKRGNGFLVLTKGNVVRNR